MRVKITIFNESKKCFSEKYVDFNDIHLIKKTSDKMYPNVFWI